MSVEAPYKVWDRRKSLGVMRDIKPLYSYWLSRFFPNQITSTDEYIDFEKLPRTGRKLAPFVRPLAAGKPIWQDSSSAYRFKPAYIKLKDAIDPLAPLTKKAGVDRSMLSMDEISPMQRRDLLRAAMTQQHVAAIERRWEWMACRAIIDGRITVEGEDYPSVELDFKRDAGHRIVKTSGNYWGDTGVSIFDDIQRYCDTMFNADFAGFPTTMTIGGKVWEVLRKDEEILKHMDTHLRDPRATVERGIIASERIVKVGELQIGGSSGARIEIVLYRDTYDEGGVEVPFMSETDAVFTTTADRIMGYQCFGAIIDPYAQYASLPIFPRSWMTNDDPAVEYMLHQSAPLMVPVNPNGTLHATVVAA